MARRLGRRTRTAGGVLGAVVVVVGVWFTWQAVHVYRDLSAAADEATALQQSLTTGDQGTTKATVAALTDHVDDARGRTDGKAWGVLTHAPLLGDDLDGVRVVSDVLADLVHDGVLPVVDSTADLSQLTPKDGRIPLDVVEQMNGPVHQADAAFGRADQRLQAQDSSGYLGRLRTTYDDLADRVTSAHETLGAASTATEVLPSMLGADGPRTYLVVFQSNAEIRATGGLPGVVALVRAADGKITTKKFVTGAYFGEIAEPVLPLTDAEQAIYGDPLGTYFLDANFTPDFPRAAALWQARWAQVYGKVDGVAAVDPVTLSYLLAATGPVQVGERVLSADNVIATLLNQIYIDVPDPATQDQTFIDIGRSLIDQLTSGVGSPQLLLSGLARAAGEHRVFLHSFHDDEQAQLAGTSVAGELVTDPQADPQVGVYLDDNTGAKMSYYLRSQVEVTGLTCRAGVQTLSGTARLDSIAPADAATSLPASVTGGGAYGVAAGSQIVAVRLVAPVGGTLSDVELDGAPIDVTQAVEQDGRLVATTYVQLAAGQSSGLTFRMTTGQGQPGDVQVGVTPGIETRNASSVTPSVC